jgi:hypothetical protein
VGEPKLEQIGKGQSGVAGSGTFLLPPAPGLCHECGHKHEPDQPHNAQTLYYQYGFANKHGRWPTWKDAVAHCTPEIQKLWKSQLESLGVWSEPKEELSPEERTGRAIGSMPMHSTAQVMKPGNLVKTETIQMGDGLRRARGAAWQTQLPIKVKVGQVWKDNDPRRNYRRDLKVLSIDGDRAVVQHPNGIGRKTKIRLDRFRPTTTGYKLVSEAP